MIVRISVANELQGVSEIIQEKRVIRDAEQVAATLRAPVLGSRDARFPSVFFSGSLSSPRTLLTSFA